MSHRTSFVAQRIGILVAGAALLAVGVGGLVTAPPAGHEAPVSASARP